MRNLGTTIEALLALGAMGGSVGSLVQELLAPQLDGQFHGAILGALAGAGVLGAVQIRRAFRAVAHGPEAVSDGPVDAVRIDRMVEPVAAVTSRPLMLGGLGFVAGSLIERGAGAPASGPILGVSLALAMFTVSLVVHLVLRSNRQAKRAEMPAAAASIAKKRARGQELLVEALIGGAAATAICGAMGTLVQRLYPAATDAGLYGLAAGMLLYGLWLVIFTRRP